jgi:hypothetical protein
MENVLLPKQGEYVNSFNAAPIFLDTNTSTGGNTNWRGSSGCTLAGISKMGIKPTRILVVPSAAANAVVTGRSFDHSCCDSCGHRSRSFQLNFGSIRRLLCGLILWSQDLLLHKPPSRFGTGRRSPCTENVFHFERNNQ